MKKIFITFFCFSLFLSCQKQENLINGEAEENTLEKLQSDFVSISDIKKAALNFTNPVSGKKIVKLSSNLKKGNNVTHKKTIKDIAQKQSSDGRSSVYIINYDNGGFTIMSDNKASQPILAYSDKGNFNVNDPKLNSGITVWLDESLMYITNQKESPDSLVFVNRLEWDNLLNETSSPTEYTTYNNNDQRYTAFNKRVSELRQANGASTTIIPLSAAASYLPPNRLSHFKSIASTKGSPEQYTIVEIIDKTTSGRVEPLMNTNWYQHGIFGTHVPNGLAGCTATAAGQIMNYYQYPSTFNWSNLTNSNLYIPNNDVPGVFMQTLGQKFNMEYKSDGSGATNAAVKSGLQSYGYSVTEKDDHFQDVYNSLNQNRPVYATGCRTSTLLGLIKKDCHAWVVEGYSNSTFNKAFRIEWQTGSYTYATDGIEYFEPGDTFSFYYVNWGWGDNYNGWFSSMHLQEQTNYFYQYSKKNLYITKP